MKVMPLPIDLEGKGVSHLEQLLLLHSNKFIAEIPSHFHYSGGSTSFGEPTSVLDSARFPTSSSSHGGGGAASTDTAGVAAVSDADPSPKWRHDSTTATSSDAPAGAEFGLLPVPPSLEISAAGNPEKLAMEDWESVLSESVAVFPTQEQSFLRWVMGDVEDPCQNKFGDGGSAAPELGFGANADLGFGAGECFVPNLPNFPRSEKNMVSNLVHSSSSLGGNLFTPSPEMKPPIFIT